MTVPTVSWDETSPANADAASQGDDRIRELKTQIREVIGVNHDFPSSGQDAGNGQHLKVTLQEQADLGTGAVNATILGSQTVGGKGELVYTDEDDNDIQITNAGKIGVTTISMAANDLDLDGILTSDNITIDTNNAYIKSKDAAGTGTVDLIKANASDVVVVPDGTQLATSAAPTADAGVSNKKYVDDSIPALGSWASKSNNTSYQAASDGFVLAMGTVSWSSTLDGYTDSSNPPTTLRARSGPGQNVNSQPCFIMFPVKSGDYYKVTGASTVYWMPLS